MIDRLRESTHTEDTLHPYEPNWERVETQLEVVRYKGENKFSPDETVNRMRASLGKTFKASF